MDRLTVLYHIDSPQDEIAARAAALAVEQSVEMPVDAIAEERIHREVVGRVLDIAPAEEGGFLVRIGLALETTGNDVGQLINMLFGNSSILDHVRLLDADFPEPLLGRYSGPRFGVEGLRKRVQAWNRPFTASAIKPLGLSAQGLAGLCKSFADAGIDIIKDDHGMGDQSYAPFKERVVACQKAVAGSATLYAPHLTGGPKALDEQMKIVEGEGVGMVMMSPMLMGLPVVQEMIAHRVQVPVLAHPAMAGASRIAPPLLLGKLFRLIGADAVVYPNHGGRFGYSPQTCKELVQAAKTEWGGFKPALPVPAGGMTLARIPEMRDFYGDDVMLLIGGALLLAKENLRQEARKFVAAVAAKEAS